MEKKIRYTLGKEERLKSRKTIDHLFKEGKSFSIFPFRILHILEVRQPLPDNGLINASHNLQAGFTVSSRNFKKAVDRNRIRRLMREAWRLQKNELELLLESNNSKLVLFFIYIGKELPEYRLVYEKITAVLKKLNKIAGERG
ncbi:MAG: ribonuclease P protein component [Ferruginibacter sp.]